MTALIIGPHISIAGGYAKAAREAHAMGANTFQFFTRNPRGGAVKAFDAADWAACAQFMDAHAYGPLLAHAPYTLNAASSNPETRRFARQALEEDLLRLEKTACALYNFHPGCHTGDGDAVGIARIADTLNAVLWPEMKTTVLLELMAGKGTEIGRTFEQAAEIISRVKLSDKLGVCLDTCHVYSAGYDIREDLDGVLEKFDAVIGLERLKAVHLNDSMTPFASNKDRHEKIGAGSIGEAALTAVVCDPRLRALPFFLETPNKAAGYKKEIALLRSVYETS